MPDPVLPDPPPGWEKILQAAKELVIVIGAVAGAIFAGVGQCQGHKNGEDIKVVAQKVDATETKVDTAAAKADEVKNVLKIETEKTQQKLGSIETEVKKGK